MTRTEIEAAIYASLRRTARSRQSVAKRFPSDPRKLAAAHRLEDLSTQIWLSDEQCTPSPRISTAASGGAKLCEIQAVLWACAPALIASMPMPNNWSVPCNELGPFIADDVARAPIPVIDPRDWQDKPVPPRDWLASGLIPMRVVTLYYGRRNRKTLTAMQLIAATALKLDWFGRPVANPGPTMLYTAEDEADELHRRFAAIVAQEGCQLSDLEGGQIRRNVGHAKC